MHFIIKVRMTEIWQQEYVFTGILNPEKGWQPSVGGI
jgi:hypothetical protein